MGQQQLLLTILVTIIIGIAMIIAINTMNEAREDANESAMRQDILMVLNDAQTYYKKSEMMGGGGSSFKGISDSDILSIDPSNENGTYEITGKENSLTVVGVGTYIDTLSATATMTNDGMEITWSKSGSE